MIQRVESGPFLRDEIARLSRVNRTIYLIIGWYLVRLLATIGSDYWLLSGLIIGYYLVRLLANIWSDYRIASGLIIAFYLVQ